MTEELDRLDQLAAEVFEGYLVKKDLAQRFKGQYPVPTYVGEFLLGRYCATTDPEEIAAGLEIVQRSMKERTVRPGEEELFKSRAREKGRIKIIDLLKGRLDASADAYKAELPSLQLNDIHIAPELVNQHERMLTGGFYAEVTLEYIAALAGEQGGQPFRVEAIQPIQMSTRDALETFTQGRSEFTLAQWRELLLRSVGLSRLDSPPGNRTSCWPEWSRSWFATTTRSSLAHAVLGSLIFSSRSPRMPISSREAGQPFRTCS